MKRILIVDDIPGWVRFHQNNIEYLNSAELEIDVAYCAKEALAKIESSIDAPYDVIFTDLQMESDFLPKMAGEWLIEQIKMYKEFNNSKIIIVKELEAAKKKKKKIVKAGDIVLFENDLPDKFS